MREVDENWGTDGGGRDWALAPRSAFHLEQSICFLPSSSEEAISKAWTFARKNTNRAGASGTCCGNLDA